jgi:pimeloyl-ACP methyl ester carboxylesterase
MQTLGKRLPFNMAADDRPAFIQAQLDFLIACGTAFREAGIDLRAYNSAENSADLEDLRRALGYDQWNLVGGSYGTRLALTSMRYRPETIRSAVLDSVYPLQANFHTEVFSSFQNSLNSLFAQCAADAACNAAYPKLDHAYDSVVARLNANPAQVPIIDPQTEQIVTYLPVSGVDFSLLMFQLSYSTPVIPILPLVIAATNNGNYELLGVLFGLLLSASGEDPAAFSFGMQVAVQCNEDATFASSRDFVAARDKNRRASPLAHIITFNEAYLDVCAAWGLTNPEPGANFRVESDRPTLIIGGTNDPITPPNYAASAAETLSRSTTVLYPRGGHTPSAISPCLARIVAAFHNDPNQRPDSSCVAAEAPLPFVTPAARSATVKIPVTTDAFGKTKTLRLSNIKALVKPASKAKAKPAATTSRTTSARNTTKAAR